MKYLEFVGILLFTVIRKTFGLVWYYVAVPFRFYARNVVYNYHLNNNLYLARLHQRGPFTYDSTESSWIIKPSHDTQGGYIQYRDISKLEYIFVFWAIWGWLDDDSYHDTFSGGYNNTLINKERMTWLPEFIINHLRDANNSDNFKVQGNSFDIGDKRRKYPMLFFWSATLWNIRNTGYNFQYKFNEKDYCPFVFKIKGKLYGWAKEPWETGYKLVLNFTHKGDVS
mgnify:FL=1